MNEVGFKRCRAALALDWDKPPQVSSLQDPPDLQKRLRKPPPVALP